MRNRKPAAPPKPLSADDVWLETVRDTLARSAARWLKASLNIDRAVKTLSLDEMKRFVEHIYTDWLVLQSQRLAAPETPADERDALAGVLL